MPATLLPIEGMAVGAVLSDDEEMNSSRTLFRLGPSSREVVGSAVEEIRGGLYTPVCSAVSFVAEAIRAVGLGLKRRFSSV